ncbi:MAG: iron-sulfur cluster assembly protein [Bacteroidetes bacterium]|jgi:probable FeS assembly SUF system protein SufT|nr:iron-sulfur cluster assembly protein [Bacteroidota bacterium]
MTHNHEKQVPDASVTDGVNPATGGRMVTEERVWEALRQCYDPEIPVNIVDLGLIYGLKIEEEMPGEANVFIRMTLTAPGCGMGPVIAGDVKRRTQQIPGVRNVLVDVVFDPPWSTSLMSEAARLMLNIS